MVERSSLLFLREKTILKLHYTNKVSHNYYIIHKYNHVFIADTHSQRQLESRKLLISTSWQLIFFAVAVDYSWKDKP